MKPRNSIPVTMARNELLMETNGNIWSVIWMIVAFVGLIAVILGNYNHIITVIVGTFLMTISKDDEENQSNLR